MRNQCQKPLKKSTSSNLTDLGWAATRIHTLVWRTLLSVYVVDWEATVKICGVAVAMLQEHNWVPNLSNGSRVNVGTIPMVPQPKSVLLLGGKARRRLMPLGWGGGPVVVCGRESRLHGEGVQCVRSINAESGGHW